MIDEVLSLSRLSERGIGGRTFTHGLNLVVPSIWFHESVFTE
jgi:hypothetical protein